MTDPICPWCGSTLTPNQARVSLQEHADTCALRKFFTESWGVGWEDGIKEGKLRERRHQRYLRSKKGRK